MLHRGHMVQRDLSDWRLDPVEGDLHAAFVTQRVPRGPDIETEDDQQGDTPDDDSEPEVPIRRAKDNIADVLAEVDDQHERDVQHHEHREHHHRQEVETARPLPAAEQLDVPRGTGGDRGGHCDAGQQHGRPQYEDDEGIRQLLERIVGAEVGQRRDLEMKIHEKRVPRARKDGLGGRDQASPLAGREE